MTPTDTDIVDWMAAGVITDALKKASLAQRSGQSHGEVGTLIRRISRDVRTQTFQSTRNGITFAKRVSGASDRIIRSLYRETIRTTPELTNALCLFAIGGYGRGLLAPHSDIDILILHNNLDEKILRPFLDGFLYPLWDSGLKIGYGIHTPSSAIDLAKTDVSACTAYLEARHLVGDQTLASAFTDRFEKHRLRTISRFIADKLKEAEQRHETFEQSRFLVEPDLKEGKGGLRDLETIGWLYHYAYGKPVSAITSGSLLHRDDRKAMNKALRFLMTARMQLHMMRGSNDNKLSFDIQPDIAAALDYQERPGTSPAERLMRHYFIYASDVGRLMRIFCARLEQEKSKKLIRRVTVLPKQLLNDGLSTRSNLTIKNNRLTFARPTAAKTHPVDWFRLMRAFSRQTKIDVHPDALELIADNVSKLTPVIREQTEIANLFRGILVEAVEPDRSLRMMMEIGLLGKFIPALGRINGRIIYGLYRRFTLDEQTIRAVAFLHRLRSGLEKTNHPLASQIIQTARDPYPFFLSVLFHELHQDTIDSLTLKEHKTARICLRLGLDEKMSANVGWASVNRQLMLDTVDRRTISDRSAIEQFCRRVETPERLELLLVVTVCYMHVVGSPENDERINRRLRILYQAARVWFSEGPTGLARHLVTRIDAMRATLEAELDDWKASDIDALFSQLRNSAVHAVEPKLWGRFARLMKSAQQAGLNEAVSASLRGDGTIEAIVYGNDRSGLLTDLAGAISALALSMRSVQAITTRDNKIIDVFVIQSVDGSMINDPDTARMTHKVLLETVRKKPDTPPKLPRRLGDRRQIFSVTPEVILDLEASDDCLVVEAVGLDRPGLLYRLTRALSEIGVIIRTAHVATYGERAVDCFYLQDAPGYKITNKRRLQSIESRLLNILTISPADR